MRVSTFICVLPVLCLLLGCGRPAQQPARPAPPQTVYTPPPPATAPGVQPADPTQPSAPDAAEVADRSPLDGVTDGEVSLARNFYFVFDGSGSMAHKPPRSGDQKFRSKLDGAKWAVDQFMEHVPDDVNFGLWLFDWGGSREVVSLGPGNREGFLTAIRASRAGGGTPLAEAIRHGAERLVAQYKRQLGYGEFRLVVVTDGQADNIPSAASYAERFGIPIYTIGFCVGENHPLREFSVSYRTANSAQDLKQGLEEAVAESETFDPTVFEQLE